MVYKALVGFLRDSIRTVAGGVSPGSRRLGSTVILAVREVDFGVVRVVRVVLRAGVEHLRLLRVRGFVRSD